MTPSSRTEAVSERRRWCWSRAGVGVRASPRGRSPWGPCAWWCRQHGWRRRRPSDGAVREFGRRCTSGVGKIPLRSAALIGLCTFPVQLYTKTNCMTTVLETLLSPLNRNYYVIFQLAYIHLTVAHSKGHRQSRAYFDCEYLANGGRYSNHLCAHLIRFSW